MKSNIAKIEALFAKREAQMKSELERLPTVKAMFLDAFAKPGAPELNMDQVYNDAFDSAGGRSYGTDAQMVIDYLGRMI